MEVPLYYIYHQIFPHARVIQTSYTELYSYTSYIRRIWLLDRYSVNPIHHGKPTETTCSLIQSPGDFIGKCITRKIVLKMNFIRCPSSKANLSQKSDFQSVQFCASIRLGTQQLPVLSNCLKIYLSD